MTRALQRERVIHIDFREHNTNQIGSGLFALAFHTSRQTFFHDRTGKVFWIFTKRLAHLSCITGISVMQRLRRGMKGKHYTNITGVLIKRPFTCDFSFAWCRKRKDSKDLGSTMARTELARKTWNLRFTLPDEPETRGQKNRIPAC